MSRITRANIARLRSTSPGVSTRARSASRSEASADSGASAGSAASQPSQSSTGSAAPRSRSKRSSRESSRTGSSKRAHVGPPVAPPPVSASIESPLPGSASASAPLPVEVVSAPVLGPDVSDSGSRPPAWAAQFLAATAAQMTVLQERSDRILEHSERTEQASAAQIASLRAELDELRSSASRSPPSSAGSAPSTPGRPASASSVAQRLAAASASFAEAREADRVRALAGSSTVPQAMIARILAFRQRSDYAHWVHTIGVHATDRSGDPFLADQAMLQQLDLAFPGVPPPVLSPSAAAPEHAPPPWLTSLRQAGLVEDDETAVRAVQGHLPPESSDYTAVIANALRLPGSSPPLASFAIAQLAQQPHRVLYVPHLGESSPGGRNDPIDISGMFAQLLDISADRGQARQRTLAAHADDAGRHVPRVRSFAQWQESLMNRMHKLASLSGARTAATAFTAITEYGLLIMQLNRLHPWPLVSSYCMFIDILWARTNLLVTQFCHHAWLAITAAAAEVPAPVPPLASSPAVAAGSASSAAVPARGINQLTRVMPRDRRYTCSACGCKGWTWKSCPRCNDFPSAARWIQAFAAGTSSPDSVPSREQGSAVPVPERAAPAPARN